MLGFQEQFMRWTALGNVDTEYLRRVQNGFSALGTNISWPLLFWLLAFFLCLVLLLILLRRIFRPQRYGLGGRNPDIIDDPDEIGEIVERAVEQRAVFDLEVFDKDYKEIYKGQVLGINLRGQAEMEISSFSDPNLDFVDKEVQIVFRMSRRGKQEFYQFNTISKYVGITDIAGRREKSVRLAMPAVIEVGQKRKHLRVEPVGRFRFKVILFGSKQKGMVHSMASFYRLHEADVDNLSIGGLQLIVKSRLMDLKVKPNQEVFVHFRPPQSLMDVENLPKDFFIQARVIAVQRKVTGRRIMSRESDMMTIGPNQIRLMFTGRGRLNKAERRVYFNEATTMAFEDLSRWIQAYQRILIREERGTEARPDRIKNIYPRRPPEVESKYPSQPPKR